MTEAKLEIEKRKTSDNQTYVSYHVSILEAKKLQAYEPILFLTLNHREAENAKTKAEQKREKKNINWIKIFRHKKSEQAYSGVFSNLVYRTTM